MSEKRRGSLLPLTYIFGSFFGAAMIATAFAYSNYRFSQYKFVDFAKLVFYEKKRNFHSKRAKIHAFNLQFKSIKIRRNFTNQK